MANQVWEIDRSISFDDEDKASPTRTFRVLLDPPSGNEVDAVAAVGVARYDAHPAIARAVARTASATPVERVPGLFDVTYAYESRSKKDDGQDPDGDPNPAGNDGSVDPTLRKRRIRYSSGSGEKTLKEDFDEPPKAVVNSAGQSLPLSVPWASQLIHIQQWLPATHDLTLKHLTYVNHVNDDLYTLIDGQTPYPIGTLRCVSYEAEFQYENNEWFYSIDVTLEFKPEGHDVSLLDQGTVMVESAALPPEPIRDSEGNPITTPIPLKEGGIPLDATEIAAGDFHYLDFVCYPSADFGALLT